VAVWVGMVNVVRGYWLRVIGEEEEVLSGQRRGRVVMRRRSRGLGWPGRLELGVFRLYLGGRRFRRGQWRRGRRRWLLPARRGRRRRSRGPGSSRYSIGPHRTNGRSGDSGLLVSFWKSILLISNRQWLL